MGRPRAGPETPDPQPAARRTFGFRARGSQGPMHVAYWLAVAIGSFLAALLALVLVAG